MSSSNRKPEKILSQKDLLSKALLKIKPDVTADDRLSCANAVKRSKRTINEYVNGHVYEIGIAVKILDYLKDVISKRTDAFK